MTGSSDRSYWPSNLSGSLPFKDTIPAFMTDEAVYDDELNSKRHVWMSMFGKSKIRTPTSLSLKTLYRVRDNQAYDRLMWMGKGELKQAKKDHPKLVFEIAAIPFDPFKLSPDLTTTQEWYRAAKSKEERVILVDFDGTIAEDVGYPDLGDPMKGVVKVLESLQDMGYRIRIYTCRLNSLHDKDSKEYEEELDRLTAYMQDNKIPYDDFVLCDEGKPFGDFYIDDKAIGFKNWSNVLKIVKREGK